MNDKMTRNTARNLKCATMLMGLNIMFVSTLWADAPTQRFLSNQATVSYTVSDKVIETSSNESVVPIISQAEIALKSLMHNGISPKFISQLLLKAKQQRFLINQATVTYKKSEKTVVSTSNVSVVPVNQPAEIMLTSR